MALLSNGELRSSVFFLGIIALYLYLPFNSSINWLKRKYHAELPSGVESGKDFVDELQKSVSDVSHT
jgi:hypothetical protein